MNKLQQRIINLIPKSIKTLIAEATTKETDSPVDAYKWRRLSEDTTRDLASNTYERMLDEAYRLFTTNPLAYRIIEITKDFIIGEGCKYQAGEQADKKIQEILDNFWEVNQFNLKQHNKAMELALYGEQIYTVSVNKIDGSVKLGYIDPLEIEDVIANTENSEEIIAIKLKDTMEKEGKTLKVIKKDTDPKSKTYGLLTGDVFYFTVNKVSNAIRGRSDLATLVDWLDAYNQFLLNRSERSELINNFIWDVTLEGMSEKEIRQYKKNNSNPPRPGSTLYHNEKVKWEANTPNMQANDATKEAKMLLEFILGGAGLAMHWYASGSDVNRATAGEMAEPILKRLQTRQAYFQYMLAFMGQYAIDQAIIYSGLSVQANKSFTVKMADLSTKDTKSTTDSLKNVIMSTSLAVEAGLMSKKRATILIGKVADTLDEKVDMEEELRLIEQESLIQNRLFDGR